MKTKSEIRFGEHHFTTFEAEHPEAGAANEARSAVYMSETNVADLHARLRYAIKNAMEKLQEADRELERNATERPVHEALYCVNTLGILQGRALEVDQLVMALHAALQQHAVIVRALAPAKEA
jgi:hypothetical protein